MSVLDEAREDVWLHARRMWESGLVVGSAGNVSRRIGEDRIAITPSSVPYDVLRPEQIAVVNVRTGVAVDSTHAPSSELPMHLAVYRARAGVGAIVHTHAPFVTTLSVLHRPLPPVVDEMVPYLGGTIEVTGYAFMGTPAVGASVLAALGDRNGVLLANHGNVCVGRDLAQALHVATVMESCARVYVTALQAGVPIVLPRAAVEAGRAMFEERYRCDEDLAVRR